MVENKVTWVLIIFILAITITTLYLILKNMATTTIIGIAFVAIMTITIFGVLRLDSKERKSFTVITQSDV